MNDNIILAKGQKSPYYRGNKKLRRSGVQIGYTEEQLIEYMKCKNDPLHFMSNYIKIISVDDGLITFKPREFQERMLNVFIEHRFSINMLPRQSGKSTIVIAYMLWLILFHSDKRIAILANKGSLSRELLGRLRMAYSYLPFWMQQGIEEWNKGSIKLENRCSIIAESTSADSIRGDTFNCLFLDEFAHVPLNQQEEFFNSVYPTISSGETTKVIIVSTPKGMNMFYKLWTDAENGKNSYVPTRVHWSEVPGRDEAWKEETIRNTSLTLFQQEQDLQFIGSVRTLIDARKLQVLPFLDPEFNWQGIDIYESPQEGHSYVITADVSEGAGLDYQAFSVIDVTKMPYKQVAKFYDRDTSYLVYPNIIHNAAQKYNNAFVLVELNDLGQSVADTLYSDLEYENVLMASNGGRKGQVLGGGLGGTNKTKLGVTMSNAVKNQGCSTLKDLIEMDQLIVNDFETISELTTFVASPLKTGSRFSAEDGHNDDLVMTLVSFAWMTNQQYFKDLMDSDLRKDLHRKKLDMMDQTLPPFGIVDDGISEESFVDDEGDRWFPAEDRYDPENYMTDDTFGWPSFNDQNW